MSGGKVKKSLLEIAVGAAVGLINGLLGGGGGMLCVPLLSEVLGEDVKVSHATTVLVIFPVCLVAAVVYTVCGHTQLPSTYFVMAGATAGGVLGSLLLKAAPPVAVRSFFALVVAGAGVGMIWR